MKRRNPALPGVSDISPDDLAALDAGRTTLQTIADKLGVSKQAVSRKIKAMRSAPTGPSISTGATATPTPTPTSTGPILIDAMQVATSACLGILHRAAGLLEGGDALGPSAIKSLASAVAVATAELRLLSVLDTGDNDTTLSVLSVRTLTDAEHFEIKRRVELPDADED